MELRHLHLLLAFAADGLSSGFSAAENPRLFVLTDIGGDPDDVMSMVRLTTYSNQIDIEGLAATHVNRRVNPDKIRRVIDAYAKVRGNLELHEPGFPPAEHLAKCVTQGLPVDHMDAVGEGKDSPGAEALSMPERPDWGGWGGRYELYTPRTEKWSIEPETRPIWTNVQDEVLGNDSQWHTTNHGTPRLTRYRRVIVKGTP